jgi:hypothetical protein
VIFKKIEISTEEIKTIEKIEIIEKKIEVTPSEKYIYI